MDEQTGRLSAITLDTAGTGYETAPAISVENGAGTGATITVDIQSVSGTITASGSGYTAGTYANVAFTGGNGQSATATFTVPGFTGTISNAGSGYTDATYSVSLRNPPTTTFTVTVVQRDKLDITAISGTFSVGNTVTGSVSGATGTVTAVDPNGAYIYLQNVSGVFLDSQQENVTSGGTSATIDISSLNVNRYLINGNEAFNQTLIDDNTYRYDQSDASNNNHPLDKVATVCRQMLLSLLEL